MVKTPWNRDLLQTACKLFFSGSFEGGFDLSVVGEFVTTLADKELK